MGEVKLTVARVGVARVGHIHTNDIQLDSKSSQIKKRSWQKQRIRSNAHESKAGIVLMEISLRVDKRQHLIMSCEKAEGRLTHHFGKIFGPVQGINRGLKRVENSTDMVEET